MHRNVAAFLAMIRHAEGTFSVDNEGYQALFGWKPSNGKVFKSFADHPRKYFAYTNKVGQKLYTSAAGAYQMIVGTYDVLHKRGIMKDFSPASQDAGAMELIREKGALDDVIAGRFEVAVNLCRKIWASLPGSGNNQPERSMAAVKEWYLAAGGTITT